MNAEIIRLPMNHVARARRLGRSLWQRVRYIVEWVGWITVSGMVAAIWERL